MKICVKCVIPDTRPNILFDETGVCQCCRAAERKQIIDWDQRWEELAQFCDKHRGKNGDGYDCIIPVSGGKDSTYQIHVMKEQMDMNPLLLNIYNFTWTETGLHNYHNMSETFGCDTISLHLNRKVGKQMVRMAYEKLGSPFWYFDRALYAWPQMMGYKLGIPLIVYGENVSYEYGGASREETPSAKEQINNNVVIPVGLQYWLNDDITMKDFNPLIWPTQEQTDYIEPIYLSYFVEWDGVKHVEIAKRLGFKTLTHEWKRQGFVEDYDQIDTPAYLFHPWLKYPKYGHQRVTDVCCNWIRAGRITREDAVKLVLEYDHILDQRIVDDFCAFTGLSLRRFYEILDTWYNRDIFELKKGEWVLKDKLRFSTYIRGQVGEKAWEIR